MELHFCLLPQGFDVGALIPQGLAGSPNHFGIFNNLVTLLKCESLKEIGEMACVTPSRSSCGQYLKLYDFVHNKFIPQLTL